jgi:CheY-like chemotaxis protein
MGLVDAATKSVRPLSRVRILLVDDDHDTRECVADVLTVYGAAVTMARSGNEGLQAFIRERPDVVLSDLWMPDGDGFEMIRCIRAFAPDEGGLTPAVAFSAVDNSKAAMMAGYHSFIAKPFEISSLLALVEDFTHADPQSQPVAPWTVRAIGPQLIVVELHDDVRGADMRDLMNALFVHLESGPVDVLVDLRRLVSFAPSVGSVGERALWSHRRAIRSLRVIGGSLLARLVSASACRLLAIPCLGATDAGASA